MSNLLTEQISHEDFKKYLKAFYKYAKKVLEIERDPRLFFRRDQANADEFIGKTGYYDPEREEIHLFITDRHAKDIVRSFAHELIHHLQKLKGITNQIDMSVTGEDPAYSLHNDLLRNMEIEAFRDGNLTFRDWTDKLKIGEITVIAERKLTPSEKQKLTKSEKKTPIEPFKKEYGEKKGKEIYYATLTKKAKSEELDEVAKLDFLDLDNDGNTSEPMKQAAKQAKQKTKKENKTMKVKVNTQKSMEEGGLPSKMDAPKKTSSVERALRDLEGERYELQNEPGAGDIGRSDKPSLASDEVGKSGEAGGIAGFLNLEKMIDDKFKDMDDAQRVRFAEFLAKKAAKAKEEARMQAKLDSGKAMKDPFTGEVIGPKGQLPESKNTPYPVLFEQRERLLKEAYQTREERVYAELVRRFIKK